MDVSIDSFYTRRSFLSAVAGVGAGVLACCGRSVAAEAEEASALDGYTQAGGFTLLPYTHYASGGVEDELTAVVLFENKNSTFTRYQVAYVSCTCRDAASNYRSVMYVELLNNKDTADEAKIRQLLFTQNEGYAVGFWGDSNPIHGQPTYTQEYMDEHFVQKLFGVTKADVDSWEGYGSQLEVVEADVLSGATVSTANIMSVLKALFEYHAAKYYA